MTHPDRPSVFLKATGLRPAAGLGKTRSEALSRLILTCLAGALVSFSCDCVAGLLLESVETLPDTRAVKITRTITIRQNPVWESLLDIVINLLHSIAEAMRRDFAN